MKHKFETPAIEIFPRLFHIQIATLQIVSIDSTFSADYVKIAK